MKIYRNVYLKSNLPRFSGRTPLYYYNKVVTNADKNGMLKEFDRNEDIYIGCDCDTPKYSALIKKTNYLNLENKKRELNYGKDCKVCRKRRF